MSIFGDSTSDISDLDANSRNVSEDEIADDHVDLENTQAAPDYDTIIEHELEDSDLENADLQSSNADPSYDDEDDRPNQFEGTAAQWRQLTLGERTLISSLDQVRAGDLSTHLYNAHSLKRRARSAAEGADRRAHDTPSDGSSKSYDQRKQRNWVPGVKWTAWPMPPQLVPQPFEQYGISTAEPLFDRTNAQSSDKPRNGLSAQLHAILQNEAKQRWVTDGGLVNSIEPTHDPANSSIATKQTMVVMADPEKADHILHPTVNSVLAKLDKLLLTLHHSRRGQCAAGEDYGLEQRQHSSIGTQDAQQMILRSIPSGSPATSRSRSQAMHATAKRTSSVGGRPKVYDKLPGESYYQMQKRRRFHRSQSRGPEDSSTEDYAWRLEGESHYAMYKRLAGDDSPHPHCRSGVEKGRGRPGTRTNGTDLRNHRDWSEVLGMAAQLGFDDAVIQRSAQRCSGLFGEEMRFRKLAASSPSELHNTASRETVSSPHEDEQVQWKGDEEAALNGGEQQLKCPVKNCSWNRKRFQDIKVRDRHVVRAHGEEALVQSMPAGILVGEVHQDGFLQMIPNENWRRARRANDDE